MILYHGSNVEVVRPRILTTNRAMDFGAGFYATSDLAQAERWAHLQARRRGSGCPIISKYEIPDAVLPTLSVLQFEEPDAAWLEYVVENRKGIYDGPVPDLVIGPVANDRTMAVVNDYMVGNIDERTALLLLEPQKLTDQYCFRTSRSVSLLACVEVIRGE